MKSFSKEIINVENENDVIRIVDYLITSNADKPNMYILTILKQATDDLKSLTAEYQEQWQNYSRQHSNRIQDIIRLKGKIKLLAPHLKHLSSKDAQAAYITETKEKKEKCKTQIELFSMGLNYLKTQTEIRETLILKEETERIHIDVETLGEYFKPQFKGMGNCYDYFTQLTEDLKLRRNAKEFAQIALMIFESKNTTDRMPQTFSKWYDIFCKCVSCERKKYNPKDLRQPREELRRLFSYL